MEFTPPGRNYDQVRYANPHGYWSLVPYTLKFLKVEPYWKRLKAMNGTSVHLNCLRVEALRLPPQSLRRHFGSAAVPFSCSFLA